MANVEDKKRVNFAHGRLIETKHGAMRLTAQVTSVVASEVDQIEVLR
jgi:hypothetical protein